MPFSITPCVMVSSLPPRSTTVPLEAAGSEALEGDFLFEDWASEAATRTRTTKEFFNMIIAPPCSESGPVRARNDQNRHLRRLVPGRPRQTMTTDNCSRYRCRHLCQHPASRLYRLRR